MGHGMTWEIHEARSQNQKYNHELEMYKEAAAVPDNAHSPIVITMNSHEQHPETITVVV